MSNEVLKKERLSFNIKRKIEIVERKLKSKYKKDLLAIILIGSFAEGTSEEDSDIDIIFVKRGELKLHTPFYQAFKNIDNRIHIIPFSKNQLESAFRNSTTMAYAIQRGKIIYQKKNFLRKYYQWPLKYPNNEWMENLFKHWEKVYNFGVIDFKRKKLKGFGFVTDCLSKGVINFGILFLETRGVIATTKKDLKKYFYKQVRDRKIREGFRITLRNHHANRDTSLNEAEKIYVAGEFLKKRLYKYFHKFGKGKGLDYSYRHGGTPVKVS